jgi:hypothetical protein
MTHKIYHNKRLKIERDKSYQVSSIQAMSSGRNSIVMHMHRRGMLDRGLGMKGGRLKFLTHKLVPLLLVTINALPLVLRRHLDETLPVTL